MYRKSDARISNGRTDGIGRMQNAEKIKERLKGEYYDKERFNEKIRGTVSRKRNA